MVRGLANPQDIRGVVRTCATRRKASSSRMLSKNVIFERIVTAGPARRVYVVFAAAVRTGRRCKAKVHGRLLRRRGQPTPCSTSDLRTVIVLHTLALVGTSGVLWVTSTGARRTDTAVAVRYRCRYVLATLHGHAGRPARLPPTQFASLYQTDWVSWSGRRSLEFPRVPCHKTTSRTHFPRIRPYDTRVHACGTWPLTPQPLPGHIPTYQFGLVVRERVLLATPGHEADRPSSRRPRPSRPIARSSGAPCTFNAYLGCSMVIQTPFRRGTKRSARRRWSHPGGSGKAWRALHRPTSNGQS